MYLQKPQLGTSFHISLYKEPFLAFFLPWKINSTCIHVLFSRSRVRGGLPLLLPVPRSPAAAKPRGSRRPKLLQGKAELRLLINVCARPLESSKFSVPIPLKFNSKSTWLPFFNKSLATANDL